MNAITPLQRWKRDDWVIPCTLRDPGGAPVDLTGSTIGAELWLSGYTVFQPLTVANGGIVRVSDAAGQFTVIASRLLTAQARGDASGLVAKDRTRVLIYKIDTYGRRQTLGVVPFAVFDGAEGLSIDEIPQVALVSESTSFNLVVAAAQGAPGPSQIGAAQISDGTDIGRALLKAQDAAAVRAALSVAAFSRAAVQDTNYAVKVADTYVGLAKLTAPRTITLPAANAYPQGQPLYVADETGDCSTDRSIIVTAAGSDTIVGQPNQIIASPYGKFAFHSNGTNLWTV
ncbi:hypothetical protein [Methylobacterium sp. Leaf117]|uniref:hypothetical protein n=1 Tax=Methylobacterium sp. Leaf117 TaxID=1736260 RepID=UPI0006FDCB16|nr:hypothetical protein [Methylobacterium sp. Leaf117]KQP82848.1 hypothetical protein ASF57_11980 [Methylobacterium sp. Leaf117]